MLKRYIALFFLTLKNRILWFFQDKASETKDKIQLKFEKDVKNLYLLSLICGALLGIACSAALLSYDGRSPINIIDFLGAFLLLPLLIYLFLICNLMFGKLNNDLTSNVKPYSKAISFGSTIFAIFGLIVLVYKSVTTDLVFGWATTLTFKPDFIYSLLKFISYPWFFLGEEFQPTLELVTESQFYRTGDSFLSGGGEGIESLKRLGLWWKYMSAAIVTYGIIPRFLIFLILTFFQSLRTLKSKTKKIVSGYTLRLDLKNLKSYFSLEREEISIYYSLLNQVIQADIDCELEQNQLQLKKEWLKKWKDIALQAGLDDTFKFLTKEELIVSLSLSSNPKAIKVMGDVLNFTPYHHLEEDEPIRIISFSVDSMKQAVQQICQESNIHFPSVEQFKNSYGSFHHNDTFWKWAKVAIIALTSAGILAITGGALAPLLGSKIGAVFGLGGARAISQGLALLGMGALSVGGFEGASTAIIIGGGGLLGGIVNGVGASEFYKGNNQAFKAELYKILAMIECEFFNPEHFKEHFLDYKHFLIGQIEAHDLDYKLKKEAKDRILEAFLSKEKNY